MKKTNKKTKPKSKKYKFNKGLSITTGMVMAVSMFTPGLSAHAMKLKHKRENEKAAVLDTNQNDPVTLTLGTPTVNVTNSGGESQDATYTIPYQCVGNTGSILQLTDVTVTPLVSLGYTDNLADGPAKTSAENWLNTVANTNGVYNFGSVSVVGNSNLNSTSTGQLKVVCSLTNLDHDTALNGKLLVSFKVNGVQYSEEVNAPTANMEIPQNDGTDIVSYNLNQSKAGAEPTISINASNLLGLEQSSNSSNAAQPYYNLSINKLKSMDIQLTAGNYSLTINPEYAKYVTSLGGGKYSISPELFNNFGNNSDIINNVFTVNTGKITSAEQLSLNAVETSTPLNSPIWGNLTITADGSSVLLKPSIGKFAIDDSANITQNQDANGQNYPYLNCTGDSKFVNLDMSDFDTYNVGLVYGGYIPVSVNGQIQINPNLKYAVMTPPVTPDSFEYDYSMAGYYTPADAQISMQKDSANEQFLNLVKGNSSKIYTGAELIAMYKNHETVPEVNAVISPYGTQYSYTALPTNVDFYQPEVSCSNTVVGIANKVTSGTNLVKYFDKLTSSSSDTLFQNGNGEDSFVLGSYGSYTAQAYSNGTYSQLRGASTCTASSTCNMIGNTGGIDLSFNTSSNVLSASQYYNPAGVNLDLQYSSSAYYKVSTNDNLVVNFQDNTIDPSTSSIVFDYINKSGATVSKTLKFSEFTKGQGNQYYIPLKSLPGYEGLPQSVGYSPATLGSINAHFTTLKPQQNLGVSVGIVNGDSAVYSSGVSGYNGASLDSTLEVNGKTLSASNLNNSNAVAQATIGYQSVAKNQCSQTITKANAKTKEFTITDSITNKAVGETDYYGIQRIPTNLSNTLGNAYNDQGTGKNTTSTLEGLEVPAGTEVYLIPNSLESKYNDQLNTKDITGLSNLSSLMNSSSGLVKYTPGMNLSVYVGFVFKTPIVKQNESTSIGFRIKCSGMTPNIINTMYTGFKYYDYSHSYGSVSQINKLNLSNIFQGMKYKDVLNLSTNDGSAIPSGAKFTITYKNGKTTIVDANKATQVIGNKAVKSVVLVQDSIPGYTVVSNNESQSENSAKTLITNTTNYVFHKIDNTVSYKAVDSSTGNVVAGVSSTVNDNSSVLNKTLTNKEGMEEIGTNDVTSVVTNNKTIPAGYKLDGGVTLTQTKDQDGDTHWVAIQKLTKLTPATVTTKMVDSTNNIIIPLKSYSGYNTENIDYNNLAVPAGYHLVSVTDNGNTYNPTGKIVGTNDVQNIVWTVEKDETHLSVTYMDGNRIVVPAKQTMVKTGAPLSVVIRNIPGYREVGITYNNKPTTNALVGNIHAIVEGNDVIVQLQKIDNTVQYKAVDSKTGDVIPGVTSTVEDNGTTLTSNLTNKEGVLNIEADNVTGVTTNSKSIPAGYIKDGNVVLTKSINKDGNIAWTAVQKLTKLPPSIVTTEVVDTTGKVLVDQVTTSGIQGESVGYKIPVMPEGYHLKEVTENGNAYTPNKSDTVIGQSTATHLVWVVEKDTHKAQVVFTSNIPGVSYGLTTNQWSGDYSPANNGLTTSPIPLNGATPNWEGATPPVGYKQVGQPKVTTVTTGTYNKVTTTTYTYKFAPIPKVTITNIVELPDGTVMPKLGDSTSGYPDGNVKLAEPNIPAGYHLVKEPSVPVLFPNSNTKCIWVIAKNEIIVNTKYVDSTTGKTITGGNFDINGKIENNAVLAPTPNVDVKPNEIPKGYREVGKEIFTNSTNKDGNQVISVVQKLEKIENKVDYKAIDQDGTIVEGVSSTVNNGKSNISKSLTNKEGDLVIGDNSVTSATTNDKSIPYGYIKSGNVTITETTDASGNITYNIIQHLVKLSPATVTTKMVTTTGEVIDAQKSYDGLNTENINYTKLKAPKGYHLVSVTNNGKDYTPTGSIVGTKDTQNIVWTVEKNNTNVTVKYMDGTTEIGTPSMSNIKTGSPLNKVKLTIPKGYRIVNVDVNNTVVPNGVVTQDALPTPNTIVVNLAKLHETVNVTSTYAGKDIAGTTVNTNDGSYKTTDSVVSKVLPFNSYKSYSDITVPEGYELSGKVTVIKSVDKLGNQIVDINVPLTKIGEGSVTTIVENTNGQVIDSLKTYEGYIGSKDQAVTPTISSKYKIISITNNGKDCKGVPAKYKKGTQNIVWTVQNVDTTATVKVIDENTNQEIGNPVTTTIATGSDLSNIKLPNVGPHYKIVSVNVNGVNEPNNKVEGKALSLPNEIIVKIVKNPTLTTSVQIQGGNYIDNPTTTVVPSGKDISSLIPQITKGYHIVSINYDNKTLTNIKDIPTTMGSSNEVVNIIVAPNTYTDKVTVKEVNGETIVPTKTTTGIVGTSTGLSSSTIVPKGWEVVNVTDNGNVSSMADKSIEQVQGQNTDTIITVKKIQDTLTTKIIDENGDTVVPSKTTTLPYGSSITGLIPSVPAGMTVSKVIYNNNNVSSVNDIPSTITQNSSVTIIVNKKQEGNITTKVETVDGQTIVNTASYTGAVGSKDTAVVPTISKGWQIVKIENNGSDVTGLPATFTKDQQNIVWIVKKIEQPSSVTVKVIDQVTGQEIGSPITSSVKVGAKLGSSYIPQIPAIYHITSVTTDGVNTGNSPDGIAKEGSNNIIINVNRDIVKEPVNAKIVDTSTGKTLVTVPTVSVNQGTPLSGKFLPKVPAGYKITGITVNGVNEPNGVSGDITSPTNIVINVTPITKGAITVRVETTTGNYIGTEQEATGVAGSKDTLSQPNIPNGYKIVSITNNGTNVKGMPDTFTGSTQNVIYTIQKTQCNVTTSIVTDSGVTIQQPQTVVAQNGQSIGGFVPVCPKGYKLTGIEVNGKNYNSMTDIPGNTDGSNIIIVEHVTKDATVPPVVQSMGKVTVKVIDNEGNIIDPEVSYSGIAGSNDTASLPNIPAGYKIDSITNNDVQVSGLPKEFNNSTQNVVYTISKITKDVSITTTIETTSGKVLDGPSVTKGKPDSASGLTLTIPAGYHLVSITNNGQSVKGLPSKFGSSNEDVIVKVEKDATPVVKHTTSKVDHTKTNTPDIPSSTTGNTAINNTVPVVKNVVPVVNNTTPIVNNTTPDNVVPTKVSNTVNPIDNIKPETVVGANPKTGDTSNLPFAVGGVAAVLAFIGLNFKKFKPGKEAKETKKQ